VQLFVASGVVGAALVTGASGAAQGAGGGAWSGGGGGRRPTKRHPSGSISIKLSATAAFRVSRRILPQCVVPRGWSTTNFSQRHAELVSRRPLQRRAADAGHHRGCSSGSSSSAFPVRAASTTVSSEPRGSSVFSRGGIFSGPVGRGTTTCFLPAGRPWTQTPNGGLFLGRLGAHRQVKLPRDDGSYPGTVIDAQ